MSEKIINKVANSVLVNFDLETYIPKGSRTFIDISQWLEQGFLLREKSFREALITHEWKEYSRHYIAIGCSTGAILPAWASLLVTSYLQPVAKTIVLGSLVELERQIFREMITELDLTPFEGKPIMIKGC